jgi:hypothetical protein
VDNLATHYGAVSVRAWTTSVGVSYQIQGEIAAPMRLRLPSGMRSVTADGVAVTPDCHGYVMLSPGSALVVALY